MKKRILAAILTGVMGFGMMGCGNNASEQSSEPEKDKLGILEIISYDLTGNIIYPIAQIVNDEADDLQKEVALDFIYFLTINEQI